MGAEFAILILAAMVGLGLAISVPCGLILRKAGYGKTLSVIAVVLALLANLGPIVIAGLLPRSVMHAYMSLFGYVSTAIILGGLWWFALAQWPVQGDRKRGD